MRKTNKLKIQVIGLLSLLIGFLPVYLLRSQSWFPTGPYWRYQGRLISSAIVETGSLQLTPFAEGTFLVTYTNDFTREFLGPLFVAIFSLISGLDVVHVHFSPIFTFVFLLLPATLAGRLVGKWYSFPLAAILAVSYQFTNLSLLEMAHRVTLGWIFFFSILLYLFITTEMNRERIFGFLLLVIAFTISYSTLAVSSLVFFSVLYVHSRWTNNLVSLAPCLLITSIVVSYYSLLNDWFTTSVVGIVFSLQQTNIDLFSLLRSGGEIHPSASPYVQTFVQIEIYELDYLLSSITARIIAVSLALYAIGFAIRTLLRREDYTVAF